MLVVLTSIVWYLKFQKASDEDKDMNHAMPYTIGKLNFN